MSEPDIPGAESIAEVEQNRDFPEPIVSFFLRSQMTVPFRVGPQEAPICLC